VIAVTGATGFVGRRVAELLAARGVEQRLVVRDPGRAPELGAEVRAIADYGAFGDVRAALDGVDTLLLVPAQESQDRLERHRTAVRAAADAGVERIVYLSFVAARADSTFTLGRDHWATEEAVRATGVAWTFPRMNLYLDFLPLMATDAGVIEGPAGTGRGAFVARADVAEVVAALLTGDHDGETHDITGPEALTMAEVAQRLTAAGRPTAFRDQTVAEAYESRRVYGAPDWQLDAWVSTYTAIAGGDVAEVTGTVERFTGHPARSLEDVLRG
jgi:NAD(P)H dehydrogenase (quinone)